MRTDSLRLAASLIIAPFDGTTAPTWLLEGLKAGLGGVILFRRNVESDEQLIALTTELRACNPDLIIAADEEGGEVTRIDDPRSGRYPTAAALGHLDDHYLTYQVGAAYGSRLRYLGVNLVLAPVADVATPGGTLGLRTFSDDPEKASTHCLSTVFGIQSNGIAACLKHFPGLGGTSVDTHDGAALVAGTLEEHVVRTAAPFAAGISAGAAAVMVGHQQFSDGVPSSHSSHVMRILRDKLDFDGLLVSDALDMGALAHLTPEERACRALEAGIDTVILGAQVTPGLVWSVIVSVSQAIDSCRIHKRRVLASVERVRGLRWEPPPATSVPGDDRALLQEVAEAALETYGDVALVTPIHIRTIIAHMGPGARRVTESATEFHTLESDLQSFGIRSTQGSTAGSTIVIWGPGMTPGHHPLPETHALGKIINVVTDEPWPTNLGAATINTRGWSPSVSRAVATLLMEHAT